MFTIFLCDQIKKWRGKIITETTQCIDQLLTIDGPYSVVRDGTSRIALH